MSWNTEKENKLKELWKKGQTGSEIAKILGTSRSAILGKVHRLKLESRTTTNKIVPRERNQVENKTDNIKYEKLSRKARFKSLLLDKNFEPENPKTLEELTEETCKWPIGHPYEENFYFCGRKSIEKFPYCKLHILYAFQPKNAKEEDVVSDEDIPQFIEKKVKSA